MHTSTSLALLTHHVVVDEDEPQQHTFNSPAPSQHHRRTPSTLHSSPVKMILRLRNSNPNRNPGVAGSAPPSTLTSPQVAPSRQEKNSPDTSFGTYSAATHRRPPSPAKVLWDESRRPTQGAGSPTEPIPAGSHRPLTLRNIILAFQIIRICAAQLIFQLLSDVHPLRLIFFVILNVVRGLFPAFRTYSQAMLLDEVQVAVSTQRPEPRLAWLLAIEFFRMTFEAAFEHYTSSNERLIQQSLRFYIERAQIETRLRLDIPALSSPNTQDLLSESEMFARSFNGVGGLGLLSPFDLVRTFVVVGCEVIGRAWVVWGLWDSRWETLPGSMNDVSLGHVFVTASVVGPTLFSLLNALWTRWSQQETWSSAFMGNTNPTEWPHALYNPEEAETCETHERMRRLAYDNSFKSEIMLFGLGDWILQTWVRTREKILSSDQNLTSRRLRNRGSATLPLLSSLLSRLPFDVDAITVVDFFKECIRELMLTLQAIPLILQLSTTTLGTATLYRTTLSSLLASVQTLSRTFDQTYQGIFLLAAFSAGLAAQPALEPANPVPLSTTPTTSEGEGLEVECRNLWYTYPGADQATIRGLNLKIGKGETVAIVGSNGSGKSTLMNLLLRLFAYDDELVEDSDRPKILFNGIDARLISPAELQAQSSAVFQGFCKFAGASVKENVGVGSVQDMQRGDTKKLDKALKDGVAAGFVTALPAGIETRLDVMPFSSGSPLAMSPVGTTAAFPQLQLGSPFAAASRSIGGGLIMPMGPSATRRKPKVGLSGGQWQRLALSRLFMRGKSTSASSSSRQPPPSLILLDEASSQLDPIAERAIFSRLRKRFPNATIVYITHRLETVRWADKVAFFEGGTITEFGTHSELLARGGNGHGTGGYSRMWRDFEGLENTESRSETTTGVEDAEEETGDQVDDLNEE